MSIIIKELKELGFKEQEPGYVSYKLESGFYFAYYSNLNGVFYYNPEGNYSTSDSFRYGITSAKEVIDFVKEKSGVDLTNSNNMVEIVERNQRVRVDKELFVTKYGINCYNDLIIKLRNTLEIPIVISKVDSISVIVSDKAVVEDIIKVITSFKVGDKVKFNSKVDCLNYEFKLLAEYEIPLEIVEIIGDSVATLELNGIPFTFANTDNYLRIPLRALIKIN